MTRRMAGVGKVYAGHTLAALSLLCVHSVLPAQTAQDTVYSYQYDAQGNVTQITDPLGRVTSYAYDALNRLQLQLPPTLAAGAPQPQITYSYDGLDQLISVTDPRNLVTTYAINGLGDRTGLNSPDTGSAANTYDAAGNLLIHTDAKGQITRYTYDVLNRVTHVDYADGSTADYTYDQGQNGIGRLTGIADSSGTTRYGYDANGRVASEMYNINSIEYATYYSYDSGGRLSGITYPSGRIVSYTRDAVGRIRQIDVSNRIAAQTVVSQVRYLPFGGVQSFVNGANQAITRGFDLNGRITSYSLRGQTQLINYDASSRIKFIADMSPQGGTTNYSYDDLDRLTSYQRPDSSVSYGYDLTGNRVSEVNGSATTTYSYAQSSNRLAQVGGGSHTSTISVDPNGSIINNGNNQFTYDSRGRLVAAVTVQGTAQYRLNALGRRVQKIMPNERTVYHYDIGGKLIGESTAEGVFRKDYVYLEDIPVAVFQ